MAGIYSQGGSAGHRYAGWLSEVEAKNFIFGGKVFNGSPSAIYVGSNLVWTYWLKAPAMTAILGAFGQRDGMAVIKATNAYLNQLDASGQAGKDKATALAALLNSSTTIAVNWATLYLDYQCVEYIASNGNQRININLTPSSGTTRLEHVIQFTTTSGRQLMGQNSGGGYWGQNASGYYERYTASSVKTGNKDLVVIDKDLPHFTVNGIETNLKSSLGWSGTAKYQMFQLEGSFGCKMRCFYFAAYSNGTLQCMAVPCYKKSNNASGLYDLATGTFYINEGSGSFTNGTSKDFPDLLIHKTPSTL